MLFSLMENILCRFLFFIL